jgi:phage shock protein PspC (stress-responsive transcriptional regulator)
MIAGVAVGLAHFFNLDPSLVRLAFVAFTLGAGGIGLLAYLILAIIMPLEPAPGMEEMRAAGGTYAHVEPSEETRRELRETRIPEVER